MTTATEDTDTKSLVVNAFTESGGIKALVDSRVVKIPEIFIHSPQDLPNESDNNGDLNGRFPVIDLQGVHGDTRNVTVEEIRKASESWGFFQILNHGIPQRVLDEMIQGVRRFHEQNKEEKMKFISQDLNSSKVIYSCASDSYIARAAIWRDSLVYNYTEDQLDSEMLPLVCREILVEYIGWIIKLKDLLCELLSEALGLPPGYLKHTECFNSGTWAGHYYPACPEPNKTLGVTKHTDHSSLTILLQDQISALQVLHQDQWVDASPIKGALIVNIGDFLQVMSNDKFKSVLHRVLARPIGPRISMPVFFIPKDYDAKVVGPIKELSTEDNLPIYKTISLAEYISFYSTEQAEGTSGMHHFKI